VKFIIGIVIVSVSVGGGFVLAKGNLATLWQPYEVIIIGGAAFGAMVIANPGHELMQVLKGLPRLFTGSPYGKRLYMEALGLVHDLFSKARKEGLIGIEDDIENPDASEIFQRYDNLRKHRHAVEMITDSLRLVVTSNVNAFELDNLLDLDIQSQEEHAHGPAHALHRVADGLPGFGIVAAVLGIVITMSVINESADVIGYHVAAALVGTFLGILLAYGFVGPMSVALEHKAADEKKFLECIKASIMAFVQGYNPQIAAEFGRKTMSPHVRPSFAELEAYLKGQ
jgi:chemotaxis protein MotA